MRPIVALLTDFGTASPYTAQMKGVILSHCPEAAVVDITHEVPPFGLSQAALFMEASRAHFPQHAVFAAVVDPGVGSERRIVGLIKDRQTFLAPDNGLLGLVVAAPGPARAFDLSDHATKPWISSTFHGRDVFAPLAAAIAGGERLPAMGPEIPVDTLTMLPWAEPEWNVRARSVDAFVLHVDRFGNCLTNIPLASGEDFLGHWGPMDLLRASGERLAVTPSRSYPDLPVGSLGLLAGSQGYLELAMNQASAAEFTGLCAGDALTLATRNPEA